jgi:hypothetical protein
MGLTYVSDATLRCNLARVGEVVFTVWISVDFSINLILPAALRLWGRVSL